MTPTQLRIQELWETSNLVLMSEPYSVWVWNGRRRAWIFKCICGNYKEIILSKVKNREVKSCGCMKNKGTHWLSKEPIYFAYNGILERCNNKNHINYHNYWGRWIKCLWKNFEEFYEDMWDRPNKLASIDRINNDWHYCKQNCRRASKKEQCRNQKKTLRYKWISLIDWCEENNVSCAKVRRRIYTKWMSIEEAIIDSQKEKLPKFVYFQKLAKERKYQAKVRWKSLWYYHTFEEARTKVLEFLESIYPDKK